MNNNLFSKNTLIIDKINSQAIVANLLIIIIFRRWIWHS